MRALTSLAGHILGSHLEINGYCEMCLSYEDVARAGSAAGAVPARRHTQAGWPLPLRQAAAKDYVLKPERFGVNAVNIGFLA